MHPKGNRMKPSIKSSRALRLLAIASLTIPLALISSSAQAADGPYDIDGDIPDSASFAELPDLFGAVKELGPLNSNTTKIGVIHSDAPPTLDLTNPNAQVDLRRAWLDTDRDAATDHDWLYFAWERDKNTGSGFIAYEFMQDPAPDACAYDTATNAQLRADCNPWANRQAGDFMILWDQQGGSLDLYLRTWTGTAPNLTLSAPDPLNAAESAAAYSADGFRGEAAVDLTATIFGGSNECLSFANTIPSTVTGNSDTADYKDTILATAPAITNCESSTVTTPKTGAGNDIPDPFTIGTGVRAVRDSAEVTVEGGSATPAGSVEFFLCKVDSPDLCDTGGTEVGSTNLSGASYPTTVLSPVAYVTSAGRYCWRAEYSGDSENGIPGSSDSSATECFTVTPKTPTLSTSAGADVTLGTAVTDTATLGGTATQPADPVINLTGAGGAAAGGTITFSLYGPSDTGCGSLVQGSTQVVTVNGNGPYNASFTPTAPGNYHWVAVYSGDEPNTTGVTHNADCTDGAEDVTVTTVASSMTTEQRWVPRDSATISAPAGGNLAGTVSFELYASSDCSGTAIYSTTRPVAGASPVTVSTVGAATQPPAQNTSGDFSWNVAYDSDNLAQEDIPASCHETSSLTINNGGTISSP